MVTEYQACLPFGLNQDQNIRFFHDFRGDETTYFEVATICGFGMVSAGNLFYKAQKECGEQDINMRPWQKSIICILCI